MPFHKACSSVLLSLVVVVALGAVASPSNADRLRTVAPTLARLGGHYGPRTGRTGAPSFHAGVDFAAPRGTIARAVVAGVVADVATEDDERPRYAGYGNTVVIHHPELGVWTLYAHLSEVAVSVGDEVEAGAPLGLTGSSSNGRFPGMGAHLHFEVRHSRRDGSAPFPGAYGRWNEDPEQWLAELGVIYDHTGGLVLE